MKSCLQLNVCEFAVSSEVILHCTQVCTKGMVKVLLIRGDSMTSELTQDEKFQCFLGEHAHTVPWLQLCNKNTPNLHYHYNTLKILF